MISKTAVEFVEYPFKSAADVVILQYMATCVQVGWSCSKSKLNSSKIYCLTQSEKYTVIHINAVI